MNIKIVENFKNNHPELKKETVKNDDSKLTEEIHFEFICAFYEKCTLPKSESLCNNFPDFTICTDYLSKRNKIMSEK